MVTLKDDTRAMLNEDPEFRRIYVEGTATNFLGKVYMPDIDEGYSSEALRRCARVRMHVFGDIIGDEVEAWLAERGEVYPAAA